MTSAHGWRVELTQTAADTLRGLGAVVRRGVASVLEELQDGPLASAHVEPGQEPVHSVVVASGHRVRFLVRPEERVILVVDIAGAAPGERPAPFAVGALLRELASEVDYGLRRLRRAPTFTAGVALTLALGLGGATTIFGLVDTVFRGALPFEDGDRLVRVLSRTTYPGGDVFAFNVTPRDYELVRDGARSFSGVVAQRGGSVSLVGEGPPERASVIGVTPGWAEVLGIRPHVGRTFTADEEQAGEDAGVVLLSHEVWQARFGGDPAAVGRELRYDGGAYRIVGVLPPRFTYPYDARLWVPWRADPTDWTSSDLNVVARLRPGVTVRDAATDLDALYAELRADAPGVAPNDGFEVRTAREDFVREGARALQSLALGVLFLVLLVCANVANLFAARFMAARREIALRAALGAGSARLLRSALVEAVLLCGLGGALGLLLVAPLGEAVSVLIPDVLRTQLDLGTVGVGPAVVVFAVAASLLTGLLTGSVAAVWAARLDLQTALRAGSRRSTSQAGRARDALVVVELALSHVLLQGATAKADHVLRLQATDLGFETEGLHTAQVALHHERYADAPARMALVERLEEALGALPDVEIAAVTSVNPLCCGNWGARLRAEGVERPADAPPLIVHHRYVTPEYFSALEVPIVRGRAFTADDRLDAPLVAIVDEGLARRLWPGQDPIGRRVGMDREGEPYLTVVGVAARAHAEGDERDTWYLPFRQDPLGRSNELLHLMVRAHTPPTVSALETAVSSVDASLPVFAVAGMDALREESLAPDRVGAVGAGAFALAGLLLAALGLYALLAFQVELRRPELGTRIALGARRASVAGLVLSGTARLFAVGAVIGTGLAYVLNVALSGLLEGVRVAPPHVYAGVVGVLALAALASALVPARRALAVDPVRALQGE